MPPVQIAAMKISFALKLHIKGNTAIRTGKSTNMERSQGDFLVRGHKAGQILLGDGGFDVVAQNVGRVEGRQLLRQVFVVMILVLMTGEKYDFLVLYSRKIQRIDAIEEKDEFFMGNQKTAVANVLDIQSRHLLNVLYHRVGKIKIRMIIKNLKKMFV